MCYTALTRPNFDLSVVKIYEYMLDHNLGNEQQMH